ncbi:MAG TPA: hypothetical protein VKY90_11445 [Candidatus Dormibacteraeota bacterium]|nr:hypothetical protein [Candidatus Dormibacteraeota bacterium]
MPEWSQREAVTGWMPCPRAHCLKLAAASYRARFGQQLVTPTQVKVAIIDALSRTGLKEIQATSFVHPRAIPQLADAEQVMAQITRVPGVNYSALVPNPKGAERAVAAGVNAVDVVVSVSRSHCLSNTNMTPEVALAQAGVVAGIARAAGIGASIGFATALGCPFEGFPPYERVEAMVATAVEEHGFGRVTIADTVGMASPARVEAVLGGLRRRFPAVDLTLHLHDTRRMGLTTADVPIHYNPLP